MPFIVLAIVAAVLWVRGVGGFQYPAAKWLIAVFAVLAILAILL